MDHTFYTDREEVNETLHRFDSRREFEAWLLSYAETVYLAIKDGDVEFLRRVVDDLSELTGDLKRDFVVADHTDDDISAINQIVDAAQSRIYG